MGLRVTLTGGAGYIGRHTLLECLGAGFEVQVIESFSAGSREMLDRVATLAGKSFDTEEIDIRDTTTLSGAFSRHRPEAVIHMAALKSPRESALHPLDYYSVNVAGTISVLRAMEAAGCAHIVYSSSAAVYGDPDSLPVSEDHPLRPGNVYGRTKAMAEQMIRDWAAAPGSRRAAVLLRYFNPVGADVSGLLGEDIHAGQDNLVPRLILAASGGLAAISLHGTDYPTPDGTGVRDYVHVEDVAAAHIAALQALPAAGRTEAYNLGIGRGVSVAEMAGAMEKVSGHAIPRRAMPRRPGDVAMVYACPLKAQRDLGWTARHDLHSMLSTAWAASLRQPQRQAQTAAHRSTGNALCDGDLLQPAFEKE